MQTPINRNVSIYIQQNTIVKECYQENKLAVEAVFRAIGCDNILAGQTKVYRNIDEYGSWLYNNKDREKFNVYVSLINDSRIAPLLPKPSDLTRVENQIFTHSCLFVSQMLKKLATDLVGPLYILLNCQLRVRLPIVPLAVATLRSELFKQIRSQRDHKSIPRIAVVRLSERRDRLHEQIYDTSDDVIPAIKELQNLFFADLYWQQGQMDNEQKSRANRLSINLSKLKLQKPLNNEFAYVVRNLLGPELKEFEPDVIILEDWLGVLNDAIDLKALAMIMRIAIQISNCRVMYVKVLGGDSHKPSGPLIMPRQTLTKQLTPLELKQRRTIYKNLLMRQSSVIMQSLHQTLDIISLQKHYFEIQQSESFVQQYKQLVDWIINQKVNQTHVRTQVNQQLRVSSLISNDILKSFRLLRPNKRHTNKFYNLGRGRLEELPIECIQETSQYYVHYKNKSAMLFLFLKDVFEVYHQSGDSEWERIGRTKIPAQQSVTDSCLIASDEFLYRMFGRYNLPYSENTVPTSPIQQNIYSDKIFQINLKYNNSRTQEDRFTYKLFPVISQQKPNAKKARIVQRRCSSSAIFVKHPNKLQQIFVFGGHLQSGSEDWICRTVLVIEDDRNVYTIDKMTVQNMEMLMKIRVRLRPHLYCLPLPIPPNATEVPILATNAFNYEHFQKHSLCLHRYHCDHVYRNSTYVAQYKMQDNGEKLVSAANSNSCIARKAFDHLLMHMIVKSTQTVNRLRFDIEDDRCSRIAVYNEELESTIILQGRQQWPSNDKAQKVDDDQREFKLFIKNHFSQETFEVSLRFEKQKKK